MTAATESIWVVTPDAQALDALHQDSAVAHLGIKIAAVGDDYLSGTMPVDGRTMQPFGLLHGGAAVLLLETLASAAANQCVDPDTHMCVGVEINCNHIRGVRDGHVLGTAQALHIGGAIDQKFSAGIYGGLEYAYRDIETPFFPNGVDTVDWDEQTIRAYFFWTPYNWLALSAEWLWEDLDRDKDLTDGAKEVKTHYIPLGFNFFHPSGFSASLKGTYVNQDGKFERWSAIGEFENGDDEFWLVDAAIRYRFPQRYGFATLGVRNLFDEDFEFFDSDENNPRIQPDQFVFATITLALP